MNNRTHPLPLVIAARVRDQLRNPRGHAGVLLRRLSKPSTIPLLLATLILPVLAVVNSFNAQAAPGTMYVAGVTFPFNGVWLDSPDGGHYWDDSGSGICRIDASATSPTGFIEIVSDGDGLANKLNQDGVGPLNTDGTPNGCK